QGSLNIFNGSLDTRIFRRKKSNRSKHQQTRIGIAGTVILDEGIELGVEAFAANFGVNLTANFPPLCRVAGKSEMLHGAGAAIERNPGHNFRMSEVASRPANFPYSIVRFSPGIFQKLQ